MHIM